MDWRINLPEVDLQTFRDLLFYLYNCCMKQDSDLTGLLTLADKYNTLELKFEMIPGTRVDYTSCVELLALADLHECSLFQRNKIYLLQTPYWSTRAGSRDKQLKELMEMVIL